MRNRLNHNQYLIWTWLQIKRQIKRPVFILPVLAMLGILYLEKEVILPSADNMSIGIGSEAGENNQIIKDEILRNQGNFVFIEARDEKELEEMVASGRVDCGFYLTDRLEESLNHVQVDPEQTDANIKDVIMGNGPGSKETIRSMRNSIWYYATSWTTKGDVAKEVVYGAVFHKLSEKILYAMVSQGVVFIDNGEDVAEAVEEANRKYQGGDVTFGAVFSEKEMSVPKEDGKADIEEKAKLIKSSVYIFLLAMACFYGKYRFSKEYHKIASRLSGIECNVFSLIAMAVPAMITGVFMGAIAKSLSVLLILYLGLCIIGAFLFGLLFKREPTYIGSVLAVLVLAAIVSLV